MIQRIQSVYLLFAALAVGATAFALQAPLSKPMPVWPTNYFADGTYWANEALGITSCLEVAFILLAVFCTKIGPHQNQANNGFNGGCPGFDAGVCGPGLQGIQRTSKRRRPASAIGSMTLPLAIVFLILALRAIRKDEALVRSSDRLR